MELAAKYIAYEHFAATSETVLQSFVVVALGIPNAKQHFQKEVLTNPLAPTSMVKNLTVHFLVFLMSVIRGRYLNSFNVFAADIPSSAGHVNSIMITLCWFCDHMRISGRKFVLKISGGETLLS